MLHMTAAARERFQAAEIVSFDTARSVTRPDAPCRALEAHETITREGDPAGSVHEVLDGAVMLYKLLPDGRRQVVELIGPGEVFGLTCGDVHDCSAESLTPVRLRVISRVAIERSPELQRRLFGLACAQMRVMHEHAVLLGRKSALERVASFLAKLTDGAEDRAIRLPMTRQEIADYLGLTIETVSRSFSELKRRGAIACPRADAVRVPDPERLQDLTGAH